MDRVFTREASLDARDPDAFPDMLSPDERCFLPAEPVAIHDIEKQTVPSVCMRDGSKKTLDLHLREVGKLVGDWTNDDVYSVSLSCVSRDLDAFTHFRELVDIFTVAQPRRLSSSLLRQRSAASAWSLALVPLLVLSAASAPAATLSRPEAKRAIEKHLDFAVVGSIPNATHPSFDRGVKDGVWVNTRNGWQPTAVGRQYFTSVNMLGMKLAKPLHRSVVAVTGIGDGAVASDKIVEFTWHFTDLTRALSIYTGATTGDQPGKAVFHQYDNGWRLVTLECGAGRSGTNSRPFRDAKTAEAGATPVAEFAGSCGGEGGCMFGQWKARNAVTVYRERSTSAPVVFLLKKGETVTGVSAHLVIEKGSPCVAKGTVYVTPLKGGRETQAPAGTKFSLLYYGGEGTFVADDGRQHVLVCCLGDSMSCAGEPHETQWLQVRSLAGGVGWAKGRENFDGTSQYD
jgi:hypothetical protein